MRLALLGLDDATVALARAAHESGRDELVLFCDFEGLEQSKSVLGSVAIRPQPWEVLLTGTTWDTLPCDAVLVSRDAVDEERRLEQLRKLVQVGMPMLVVHPVHSSMLAYYELDMIRRETGCLMLPRLPARLHPLAVRVKELIDRAEESPLGTVDQIVFERSLAERTKASVVAQFARDIDLLRFLGGEVTQLGAMGSPGHNAAGEFAAYNNLGVQMASSDNRLLRWWVGPADEFPGARLTVTGQRGKAILTMPAEQRSLPDNEAAWRLEIRTAGESRITESGNLDPNMASLDELRAALSDRETPSRWPDAARSVELAETIERSLAKGRTIDLHEQEFSDASTFKGLMTSVGCALLVLALVAMVIGAMAANFLKHAGADRAARVVGALPYVLLSVFVVFLALQFLLKLARPAEKRTSSGAADRDEEVSANSGG